MEHFGRWPWSVSASRLRAEDRAGACIRVEQGKVSGGQREMPLLSRTGSQR